MKARRGGGFTLVEVLVALAIVAVVLAAGAKAAGALADNAQRLTDVVAAQWCADNQVAALRLQLQQSAPATGDSSFACELLGRRYAGQQTVRPSMNPNFREVQLTIAAADGRPVLTLFQIAAVFR